MHGHHCHGHQRSSRYVSFCSVAHKRANNAFSLRSPPGLLGTLPLRLLVPERSSSPYLTRYLPVSASNEGSEEFQREVEIKGRKFGEESCWKEE